MVSIALDMQNIKAILFDLDGVLVDSFPAWFCLFNDALEHFGFNRISKQIFQRHWGQSTEEDVRIFMPGKTVSEVRDYFLTNFSNYLSSLKINPLAQKILSFIEQQNLKLACVTNSHRDIAQQILTRHHLDTFFQIIITADDVKKPKPAPDMLLAVCRSLKIRPEQAVFIGDTLSDKRASIAAGCIFIGYKLSADLTIDNLNALCELLSH